jgi:thioredoxin 1
MIFGDRPWLGQVPLRRKSLGAAPISVTDATFQQQVLSAPKAVVDFWSPSCPVCQRYKPVFEAAAAQAPSDVLMVEANVDEANFSAQKYGFTSIPTTVFLMNGKPVNQISGDMSAQDLLAAIQSSFSGGGAAPAPSQSTQASATTTPAPSMAPAAAPPSTPLNTYVVGGVTLAAIAGLGYLVFK